MLYQRRARFARLNFCFFFIFFRQFRFFFLDFNNRFLNVTKEEGDKENISDAVTDEEAKSRGAEIIKVA
ncbi:unnamed protein product [Oikopleura dioica]|uniref:Uncharacterized protein n=1 Tax=Oikopleura dioica TaxID=34765 RepID=E4XP16_OIKDI|nr:unnamed protein product [Oikopleura dioica]